MPKVKLSSYYHYEQKFRKAWLQDDITKDWVIPVYGDATKAHCKYCKCEIKAKIQDLKKHAETNKHRNAQFESLEVVKTGHSLSQSTTTTMASDSFLNLQNKVVLITGASAGIGEATAYEFARQGCHLMLHGRDRARLEAVSKASQELGGERITVKTTLGDITESATQEKIIEDTLSAFGKIDVLVNNAGMNIVRDAVTTTRDIYKQIMDTNMESVFFLTQLAIPHLIKSKGNIVNVSSIASHTVMPKSTVYTMSKAALDSYTKCLALELAPHGVRVNSVNPGSVVSLIYKRGEEALSDKQYEEFMRFQSSSSLHPLGRMVQASEVADSIVFVSSERASFITGQSIYVDGGRHCVGPQPRHK